MRVQIKVIDPDLIAFEQKGDNHLTFIVGVFTSDTKVDTGEIRDLFVQGNSIENMSICSLKSDKEVKDIYEYEGWTESADKVVLKMGFNPKDEVTGVVYFVNTDKVPNILDGNYQGYFIGTIGGNKEKLKDLSKQVIEANLESEKYSPLKSLNYNIQHKVGNHLTWALKEHKWGFSNEFGKALDEKERVGLRTFMDNISFKKYMNDIEDFKNGKPEESGKVSLINNEADYRYALKKCLKNDRYQELSKKMFYNKEESNFINKIMRNAIYGIDEQESIEIRKIRNKV